MKSCPCRSTGPRALTGVGLRGLAERLQRKYAESLDRKGKKLCEQILKTSKHILALSDNKMNAYIETKESPLQIERIRLKEIMEEFFRRYFLVFEGVDDRSKTPEDCVRGLIHNIVHFVRENTELTMVSYNELPLDLPEIADLKASRITAGVKVIAKAGCTSPRMMKIPMKMANTPMICHLISGDARNSRSAKKANGRSRNR